MSVLERLKDAEVLFDAMRYEGALLQLLVAVAATSRKRYSRDSVTSDRDAFTRFLRDEMQSLSANPIFNSKRMALHVAGHLDEFEGHLYRYMRCSLVHEAKLDSRIKLVPGLGFFLGFNDPTCLQLSNWIHRGLYRVLTSVEENIGDGFGRRYLQTELVDLGGGWLWWVAEDWSSGRIHTETGIPAHRTWDSPQKSIDDLEREPDLVIKRSDPSPSSEEAP